MDDLLRWALGRYPAKPPKPALVKHDGRGRPRTARGHQVCMMAIGDFIVCETPEEADTVSGMIRHLGGKAQKNKSREGFTVRRTA